MMIYISGPMHPRGGYTREHNIEQGLRTYVRLLKAGLNCISPHVNDLLPPNDIDYERWMALDFALIDVSTHVLMLPRWKTSFGAVREHDYARETNKPIFYDIIGFLV